MCRGLEERDFLRLRLLDLDDHVGGLEHRRRVGEDGRPGLREGAVGAVDAIAGTGFDHDLMPGGRQLGHRGRGQADPIFMHLDFLRHPDAHRSFAPMMGLARPYRQECRRLQRLFAGARPARHRA